MQLWNDFAAWVTSETGWRIVSSAVIPFVAILVSGLIAALVGRGSVHRVVVYQNRELQAAAVATMIEAARPATVWSGLSAEAHNHAESQASAADIRLRLLPVNGASAAADWADHQLRAMRRDSASFSFQAEQTYVEFRDRLLEWQAHPRRARKLFALDLERFRYEDAHVDAELVEQQQRWAAEEVAAASTGLTSSELAAAEGGVDDADERPLATTPSVSSTTYPLAVPPSPAYTEAPGPGVTDRPAAGISGPPPVIDSGAAEGTPTAAYPPFTLRATDSAEPAIDESAAEAESELAEDETLAADTPPPPAATPESDAGEAAAEKTSHPLVSPPSAPRREPYSFSFSSRLTSPLAAKPDDSATEETAVEQSTAKAIETEGPAAETATGSEPSQSQSEAADGSEQGSEEDADPTTGEHRL
jgi:hypothetical protein